MGLRWGHNFFLWLLVGVNKSSSKGFPSCYTAPSSSFDRRREAVCESVDVCLLASPAPRLEHLAGRIGKSTSTHRSGSRSHYNYFIAVILLSYEGVTSNTQHTSVCNLPLSLSITILRNSHTDMEKSRSSFTSDSCWSGYRINDPV